MGRIEMFVHLVWATWQRMPLIDDGIQDRLHGAIFSRCLKLRCRTIAVGGTADHVHLLTRLHPSVAVARLVAEAKGWSSYLMTHEIAPGRFFRWQERYGAVTVSLDDLGTIERYVRHQRQHHGTAQVLSELEPSES